MNEQSLFPEREQTPRRAYQAPEVEIVEVLVEYGMAGSETGANTPTWNPEPGEWE